MKCYTDAAVNGNPGNAGIGFVILSEERYEQVSLPLNGKWNNHLAEFEAVIQALNWTETHLPDEPLLFLYTDSKIVSESIRKKYAKNPDFMLYTNKILEKLKRFNYFEVTWLPESRNKGADNLARQGLQKALST